jgi:mRNA interferase YafQ
MGGGVREVVQTAQFKKDLRKVARSGRHRVEDLLEAVDDLARDQRLPERYRDHALTGDLSAYRECHIRPDWLLMYELTPGRLVLVRTGSYSELFD